MISVLFRSWTSAFVLLLTEANFFKRSACSSKETRLNSWLVNLLKRRWLFNLKCLNLWCDRDSTMNFATSDTGGNVRAYVSTSNMYDGNFYMQRTKGSVHTAPSNLPDHTIFKRQAPPWEYFLCGIKHDFLFQSIEKCFTCSDQIRRHISNVIQFDCKKSFFLCVFGWNCDGFRYRCGNSIKYNRENLLSRPA